MFFTAACTGSYDPAIIGHHEVAMAVLLHLKIEPPQKMVMGIGYNADKTRFVTNKDVVAALMLIGTPQEYHDRICITTVGTADLAAKGVVEYYARGLRTMADRPHERDAYLKKLKTSATGAGRDIPQFILVVHDPEQNLNEVKNYMCESGFPVDKITVIRGNPYLGDISSTLVRNALCQEPCDQDLIETLLPQRVGKIFMDIRQHIRPNLADPESIARFNDALLLHPAIQAAMKYGRDNGIIIDPDQIGAQRPLSSTTAANTRPAGGVSTYKADT